MGAEIVAARRRDPLPAAVLRRASDQCLVEQALAGSERAFEVLVDRHRRPVLAYCKQMLGSWDEAEDAVQQTFLAAHRELGRAEQPPELRPWLYAVARHRCLSALRARRARSLQEVPERGADRLIIEVTVREDLRAALADVTRLPDDQRAALMLAALGDMSHAEIARILGCPQDKVKALVFQARSSLVTARAARESPCAEIQEQLRTLRAGALRRAVLRRHLHDCPGCRAYREKLRIQRRRLGLLLPVCPTFGLKRGFLGAFFASGGGGGGAALTAGALSWAGLAATALVAVTIPAGTVSAALTGVRDGRQAARPDASTGATGPGAAPASASSVSAERAREDWSAGARVKEPLAQPRAKADDTQPAPLEQADARDEAVWAQSPDQAELPKPEESAQPPEPPEPNPPRPVKPAKPLRPPMARGHVTPAKPATANRQVASARPPKANGHLTPAKPPKADGPVTSAKPPTANSRVAPAKPADDHVAPGPRDGPTNTGPDVARASSPAPRPSPEPSPGGADTPGAPGNGHGGDERAPATG